MANILLTLYLVDSKEVKTTYENVEKLNIEAFRNQIVNQLENTSTMFMIIGNFCYRKEDVRGFYIEVIE